MESGQGTIPVLDLGREALQANEAHQHALKHDIQRLEVELDKVDKLLDAIDVTKESDLEAGGSIIISGAVKAAALIIPRELLSPESSFHDGALKCNIYQSLIEVHPMKTKELEALAEAVRTENYRRHALDLQRGGSPFSSLHLQNAPYLESSKEGLDWNRIADKVVLLLDSMLPQADQQECRVRWLGEQHPDFNHGPWAEEEILRVKTLAAGSPNNQPDWVVIAEQLGTKRTPLDCMRHATTRKSHQWTTLSDERLLKAIGMYGQDNWHLVARYVSEDVTPQQCSNRFQRTVDPSIKRIAWTPEEDAGLCAAVAAYGSSWVDVAACVPGRLNDQCRDRWTEQSNPSTSGNHWTEEEDRMLIHHVHELKGASWKDVAERLRNGRTEDMCRARYFTLQKGDTSVPTRSIPNHESRIAITSQETTLVASTSADAIAQPQPSSYPSSSTVFPAETHHANQGTQIVFLDPVVSLDPKLHKHRRPRPPRTVARFKTTTPPEPLPSNTPDLPPPRKRKKKKGD